MACLRTYNLGFQTKYLNLEFILSPLWGTNFVIRTIKKVREIELGRGKTFWNLLACEFGVEVGMKRANWYLIYNCAPMSSILKLKKVQVPYRLLGRCLDALWSSPVSRGKERNWVEGRSIRYLNKGTLRTRDYMISLWLYNYFVSELQNQNKYLNKSSW